MIAFARFIDTRLAGLPRGLALQWPGGRAGPEGSAVHLKMRRRQLLADLAQGRIGDLADAYVRGDLEIEGSLPDVMAVAAALVGSTVRGATRIRFAATTICATRSTACGWTRCGSTPAPTTAAPGKPWHRPSRTSWTSSAASCNSAPDSGSWTSAPVGVPC
jgi:hypothetical protein